MWGLFGDNNNESKDGNNNNNKNNKRGDDDATIPPALKKCLPELSEEERRLVETLCTEGKQSHLFVKWDTDKTVDSKEKQRSFIQSLVEMDKLLPEDGLMGYITTAKKLLSDSKQGLNPLDGWVPSIPSGESFTLGTREFYETEQIGMKELGKVGFILVAGGLGERLGYGNIKIGLPTELATGTCYLEYYIKYILAVQDKFGNNNNKKDKKLLLPLCIMTSSDTNPGTIALLEKNDYFGMDKSQITLVQQGIGVPALQDNDARIALDPTDPYKFLTKPHGHGDVHSLLYTHGVVKKWLQTANIKWLFFFQDTNGLAFNTLPLCIGVSMKLDLVMNSMCCPRKAKQAIGAITKLTQESTGKERTINVEYNQLDPLLRATGFAPNGDVNDETTGFSPFPGNINQLLMQADAYERALDRTRGLMPEFVNPKYKDASKTVFKKPTRLECMMQDFPTVLDGDEAKKVGFTSIAPDMCFSPCKNATADGVKLQQRGIHGQCAATAEADQYGVVCKILQSLGVNIELPNESTYTFLGVAVPQTPEIVISPSIACCASEIRNMFPKPSKVHISKNSSLIIEGSGTVVIEQLKLDGALHILCEEGAEGVVCNMWVKNKGWERVALKEEENVENEVLALRGYKLVKKETEKIVYKQQGCNVM